VVADRTYKQWFDYHYKKLKKEMPDKSDSVIKMLAGDQAQRSFNAQQTSRAQASAAGIAQSATTPRVGPGATSAPVPKPTPTPVATPVQKRPGVLGPTPAPTTTPVVTGSTTGGVSYNDKIVSRIKATGAIATSGITTTKSGRLDWVDFLPTLDNQDYIRLQKVLKDLGYTVKNKAQIDYLLSTEFQNLFPAKDVDTLVSELNKFKLPGAGEEAELPLRQIPAIDRGSLVNLSRKVADAVLMMGQLTPELEKQVVDEWMADAKKGTVTMPTKKVRNPKTGKLENVVETKRAFDEETAVLDLTERLKQMFPDQYELASGIGFAADIKKILAGGQ
jgi:polyhydroxyalkanoate synthesis regulator phasin